MAYGVYSDRGYREHILERNKNSNKTEVFTQEDQTFTGRKTFLSGVTTSDLEVQTVEVSESLKVKGKDIKEIIGTLNTVKASVEDIQALIPNQATKDNQLADKYFVNSSISTNTANFLGTFNTLEEIEALTDVTNNDYAFWKTTDTLGSVVFKRYKYIADEQLWKFEYDLNNSSFTAVQWEAINSGITAELVAKIGDVKTEIENSLKSIMKPNYTTGRLPAGVYKTGQTVSVSTSITTTRGNPVFISYSGDFNNVGPGEDTPWIRFDLYADDALIQRISVDNSSSHDSDNTSFAGSALAVLSAGSHTIRLDAVLSDGRTGQIQFQEQGNFVNLVAFEL